MWCGAECPGTAADTPVNWSTSLAGVRVDEAKLKAGNTKYTMYTMYTMFTMYTMYTLYTMYTMYAMRHLSIFQNQ